MATLPAGKAFPCEVSFDCMNPATHRVGRRGHETDRGSVRCCGEIRCEKTAAAQGYVNTYALRSEDIDPLTVPAPGLTCNGKPVVGVKEVPTPKAGQFVAADHPRAEPEAGHPGFLKLLDEIRELHCRKAADYGHGKDLFANLRASAAFGVPAWVGAMIRANDKVERIKAFIEKGSLKNESVEDSLIDLAAYALIALALRREDAAGGSQATTTAKQTLLDEQYRGILRTLDALDPAAGIGG